MAEFLLLRPEHKCQSSKQAFNKAGLNVSTLALQRISRDQQQLDTLAQQLQDLPQDSLVILVSTVAAELAASKLAKSQWPQHVNYIAVGQSSGNILKQQQINVVVPTDERTEGLLELTLLQEVADKQVVIVKGQNGRETLKNTLNKRGAQVSELCVYHRVPIPIQPPGTPWEQQSIQAVICTSTEQLNLALDTLPTPWLKSLPWILVSERTAQAAKTAGIQQVSLSRGASDQALIEASKLLMEQIMSDKPSPKKDTANVSSDKAKIAPSSTSSRSEKKHTAATQSQGSSGWIKLLTGLNFIALIGAGAAGFWAWQQWQVQQSQWVLQPQLQQAQSQLSQSLNQAENQFSSGLKQVEQSFSQQLASTNSALQTTRRDVEQISGRRPNQWLMAEAEYLIRMAGRKLWLEQDQGTAIQLLQDADQRLQHMNNPALIPVRKLLYQDIQSLEQINPIDTSALALKLLGLVKSADTLPLAMVQLPESEEEVSSTELSSSASDWKSNLKRSWEEFTQGFINVTRRQDSVRPMMSQQQQWLTRQQLQHYLLQAQSAVTSNDSQLYRAWLQQAQDLLAMDFDNTSPQVSQFNTSLNNLKGQNVSREYPSVLNALQPLQDILASHSSILAQPQTEQVQAVQP